MEYSCHTICDRRGMTALVRALRKTVRKKATRRIKILGWIICALAAMMLVVPDVSPPMRGLNFVALVVILVVQIWGDSINGWMAQRNVLPGAELWSTSFYPDHYECRIAGATTSWSYEKIVLVAESREYFFFIMGKNHAQIYQKSQLKGGTVDSFRGFLEQRTGKAVERISG